MSKHPPQQYRLLNDPAFLADMANPDITLLSISLKHGASYPTVCKIGSKYGLTTGRVRGGTKRKVNKNTIERIKKLTLDGLTVEGICNQLDLSPACVVRHRKNLGLTKAYKRKEHKRVWNNADTKSIPCSRIALIRASNFATTNGRTLKDIVDAAVNQYIDSQSHAATNA
jgi:hypothetical protein